MQNKQAENETTYVNTYTTGLAYLNGIVVKKEKGRESSISVRLSALQRAGDKVHYESYEVYVVGKKAIEVIEQLQKEVDLDKEKVVLHFCISNARSYAYMVESGDYKGQARSVQKGNLIKITYVKVGDEVYFSAGDWEEEAA